MVVSSPHGICLKGKTIAIVSTTVETDDPENGKVERLGFTDREVLQYLFLLFYSFAEFPMQKPTFTYS